jgi:tetratricopeptide (TPR) repeat protein
VTDSNGPTDNDNVLRGYHDVPEEDRKKAQVFFDRGKTVADTGNFEYAIEMYIQGLGYDPENVEAHQTLREISLKRRASGGKDMGMMSQWKLPKAKDDKQAMLNTEQLLAYSPGNTDRMLAVMQSAYRAGCYDTVLWVAPILLRANADDKKPDFKKFISLRDTYNALERYDKAAEAAQFALTMRPDDMDLQQDMKNLAARHTMKSGNYGIAKSFRESMRDQELQERLLEQDKDVHAIDALERTIRGAEAAWQGDPEDQAKLTKLVDALRRPESDEYDERAVKILEDAYQKTGQFKWRQRVGEIRMAQFGRQERSLRTEVEANRNNPDYQEQLNRLRDFRLEKYNLELREFQLVLEHYPTDSNARFQVAVRLFQLGKFQDAIPVFQQVRNDPKYRVNASILLGQAFLMAGFHDEAVDTIKAVIDEYPNRGDDRSIEMFYWYGRSLEEKKDVPAALKAYSQVAQWNFNYRDVQGRVKSLRSGQ